MQADNQLELAKIVVLDNLIEAQLISSILGQRNIDHRLRSYHDTAYDGLFQAQKGWGELQAPRVYRKEILALLTEIRETNFYQNNESI